MFLNRFRNVLENIHKLKGRKNARKTKKHYNYLHGFKSLGSYTLKSGLWTNYGSRQSYTNGPQETFLS